MAFVIAGWVPALYYEALTAAALRDTDNGGSFGPIRPAYPCPLRHWPVPHCPAECVCAINFIVFSSGSPVPRITLLCSSSLDTAPVNLRKSAVRVKKTACGFFLHQR